MAEEALAAAKSAALARLSAMQAQPGQSLPDATELLQSFPAPGSVAAPLATSTSAATPAAAAASPAQDNCRSKAVRAPQQMLRVAVQGCAHGELDNIYNTIADMERSQGLKIDLLLCCGDFQAVRFKSDLECMAVPAKFRKLGTFYRYCKTRRALLLALTGIFSTQILPHTARSLVAQTRVKKSLQYPQSLLAATMRHRTIFKSFVMAVGRLQTFIFSDILV